MEERKFSIEEALSYGWNATKNNLLFFIGFVIIILFINIVSNRVSNFLPNFPLPVAVITYLILLAINVMVNLGITKIALKYSAGDTADYNDLFSCSHLFFKYLFASLLYSLIFAAGLILLIVPGIIWAVKFSMFGYLIVDKEMGPIEALKRSAQITCGIKKELALFYLLSAIINIAGLLCLIVGLFVTIPTTLVALAFIYRKISQEGLLAKTI